MQTLPEMAPVQPAPALNFDAGETFGMPMPKAKIEAKPNAWTNIPKSRYTAQRSINIAAINPGSA